MVRGKFVLEPQRPSKAESLSGRHARARVSAATYPQLVEEYLDRILIGDRSGAVRLLVNAVEHGEDPLRLMDEVVEPAREALARRMTLGSITTEQRRHGETVTDLSVVMLRPPVFEAPPELP